MFKEMAIKGGLMVGALIAAQVIIGKLEDRALKRDIEKVKSEGEGNEQSKKDEKNKLRIVK